MAISIVMAGAEQLFSSFYSSWVAHTSLTYQRIELAMFVMSVNELSARPLIPMAITLNNEQYVIVMLRYWVLECNKLNNIASNSSLCKSNGYQSGWLSDKVIGVTLKTWWDRYLGKDDSCMLLMSSKKRGTVVQHIICSSCKHNYHCLWSGMNSAWPVERNTTVSFYFDFAGPLRRTGNSHIG